MAQLIATTVPGFEDLASGELREGFGLAVEATRVGAVCVRLDADSLTRSAAGTIAALHRWARGLHRVGLLLAEAELPADPPSDALGACYEVSRGIDFRPWMATTQSFAVRPARRGRHAFGSPDVGRVVGQAVIDAYRRAAGVRPAVDLDDPDVILRAEVIDSSFRLWLDCTGDAAMDRRGYRRQHHPAALPPHLAHLLLRAAGWSCQPLLDPMCGVGTIPIEAAMWGRGLAPGAGHDGRFSWQRLAWGEKVAASAADAATDAGAEAARPHCASMPTILGVERFARHVQGALLNAAAAGVTGELRIVRGDAADLRGVAEPGDFRLAVVNPPFGRRVGSPRRAIALYRNFSRSAAAAGIERLVALSELAAPLQEALETAGYAVVGRRAVRYGDLDVELLVAELS